MPLISDARFAHTNLIARDWRTLASFYERVFGCTPVPPERDYSGADLEAGTGLPGAALQGVHLRLPGASDGADGPTLEIYTFAELNEAGTSAVNQPGFAHIAFQVPNVADARQTVLAEGATPVGEVVTSTTADGSTVTWCYVRDPEGNAIELQSWKPVPPAIR